VSLAINNWRTLPAAVRGLEVKCNTLPLLKMPLFLKDFDFLRALMLLYEATVASGSFTVCFFFKQKL